MRSESEELLGSLVDAEAQRKTLQARQKAIEGDLPSIPANLSDLYAAKVEALVETLSYTALVHRANEALGEIVDHVEVGWDNAAGAHSIRVFDDLFELLEFSNQANGDLCCT